MQQRKLTCWLGSMGHEGVRTSLVVLVRRGSTNEWTDSALNMSNPQSHLGGLVSQELTHICTPKKSIPISSRSTHRKRQC